MKFFVTKLLLSTLLLVQGCKSSVESKEAQTTTSPHHNHSMASMEHSGHSWLTDKTEGGGRLSPW
ncbi:MAG TPA: hypothetical protein V6D09_08690 [Leptolyngbyaceae cyanobacterium]